MNARSVAVLAALAALVLVPAASAYGLDVRVRAPLVGDVQVAQAIPLPAPVQDGFDLVGADAPEPTRADVALDPYAAVQVVEGVFVPHGERAATQDAPRGDGGDAPVPLRAHALLVPLTALGGIPAVDLDGLTSGIPLGPLAPAHDTGVAPPAPVAVASVAPPAAPAEAAPAALAASVSVVALAAATAAAPAASFGWERLKRLVVLAALYTRIAKENLLDHGSRERLLAAIRDTPGLPVTDLAARTGVPRNTATYHLRRLEREGLVTSSRSGRVRVWFVPGTGATRAEAPAYAALRHQTTRAIAMEVAAAPGVDQQALCQRFGLAPSLAHWHADRLVECGLVRKERDGRRVRYYPTEGLPRVAAFSA